MQHGAYITALWLSLTSAPSASERRSVSLRKSPERFGKLRKLVSQRMHFHETRRKTGRKTFLIKVDVFHTPEQKWTNSTKMNKVETFVVLFFLQNKMCDK